MGDLEPLRKVIVQFLEIEINVIVRFYIIDYRV